MDERDASQTAEFDDLVEKKKKKLASRNSAESFRREKNLSQELYLVCWSLEPPDHKTDLRRNSL